MCPSLGPLALFNTLAVRKVLSFAYCIFLRWQSEIVAREKKLHTIFFGRYLVSRIKQTTKWNENKSFRFGRYVVSRTNEKHSFIWFYYGAFRTAFSIPFGFISFLFISSSLAHCWFGCATMAKVYGITYYYEQRFLNTLKLPYFYEVVPSSEQNPIFVTSFRNYSIRIHIWKVSIKSSIYSRK